jgi:SAM-dependent methyltransferase
MNTIGLEEVQAVYSGPEGELWKLVMGEQIHIGGMSSSIDLAERAGIRGMRKGVDFCCCLGAGMRFLVRFQEVGEMEGIDATSEMVEQGRRVCFEEGLSGSVSFNLADVCTSGLPDEYADFIWGEDAWCYVVDKALLISEAARIVKQGGTIAFTDWVIGPAGFTQEEAERFMAFMKFPNMETLDGYSELLAQNGCEVISAVDTKRFADHVDLYISMVGMQLTYDALKIVGFDPTMLAAVSKELAFVRELAHAGKLIQGLIIARKL